MFSNASCVKWPILFQRGVILDYLEAGLRSQDHDLGLRPKTAVSVLVLSSLVLDWLWSRSLQSFLGLRLWGLDLGLSLVFHFWRSKVRNYWRKDVRVYLQLSLTSTTGVMDPEGSAHNSCNSWPVYALWADKQAYFGQLLQLLHALPSRSVLIN